MRFPPSLLDEIRARLPVSSVAGRRVRLKRQGREYVGLSPFKQEKTPSFTVNDQKGFYHCFATGEHGDIFTFLQKVEGLSFPEAVERLAREAGVEMPRPSPQAEAHEAQAVTLRRITEESCRFFEAALAGPQGRDARAYLERRGLGEAEIARFRLGYAPPGRHQLKEHLAAKGFSAQDMAASGMVVSGDDIPVSYDRFRNRLIFPIADLRGEVIAFGGRALGEGQQPKYLNSPETSLFHKGSVLFNAAAARKAAHETGEVMVAEGYMDVIALHRAGIAHAVAPLGTALTPDQLKMLWRMADEPILCFDGDAAGMKAAHRATETALPLLTPGKSLGFVFLPDGLDPDDLLRERGPAAVAEALGTRRPLIDVLWDKELRPDSWRTPEKRAEFEERLHALVNMIANPTVKKHYRDAVKDRIWKRRRPPRDGRAESPRTHPRANLSGVNGERTREAELLKAFLDHEQAIEQYYEEICGYDFESEEFNALKQRMLELYLSGKSPLRNALAREERMESVMNRIESMSAIRSSASEMQLSNIKTFFEIKKAEESRRHNQRIILETVERGDEAEWQSLAPVLGGDADGAGPKSGKAVIELSEKTSFEEMKRIALERVARANGRRR